MNTPDAPYLPTALPDTVESTPLARAGWPGGGQHGGVVAALLGRAVESVPTLEPMGVARLTVELFRLVPIVPLRSVTRIVREGKKIQVVEASLLDPDGTELARAVALRLRLAALDLPDRALTPPLDVPLPDQLPVIDQGMWGIGGGEPVLYHRRAVQVKEINKPFADLGPGALWMRVVTPLVAGEPITPLTRAVVVGDFVNGLSRLTEPTEFLFMNADLTVHLQREPRGEWVGVDAHSRYEGVGRGTATGRLFDTEGEIGRSTQTLFIDPA